MGTLKNCVTVGGGWASIIFVTNCSENKLGGGEFNKPLHTLKCQINGGPNRQGVGKNSEIY